VRILTSAQVHEQCPGGSAGAVHAAGYQDEAWDEVAPEMMTGSRIRAESFPYR
jgi:hypothetical protein